MSEDRRRKRSRLARDLMRTLTGEEDVPLIVTETGEVHQAEDVPVDLAFEQYEVGTGDDALIARVYALMSTDDDLHAEDYSECIVEEYRQAPVEQQKLLDRVFVYLCGYRLKTLIEGHTTDSYHPFR